MDAESSDGDAERALRAEIQQILATCADLCEQLRHVRIMLYAMWATCFGTMLVAL